MKNFSLGIRLQALFDLIESKPFNFYDLCCDHGHLGLKVYQTKDPQVLILNDQVKAICDNINSYVDSYIPSCGITVLNQDAKTLKLKASKYPNIITIAGIGGPLLIKIVENLKTQLKASDELILSPHTKIHDVRKYLSDSKFNLIEERLVTENDKFYEMLKVNLHGNQTISLVGQSMWDLKKAYHRRYLSQLIDYYQIKAKNDPNQHIKLILSSLKALNSPNK